MIKQILNFVLYCLSMQSLENHASLLHWLSVYVIELPLASWSRKTTTKEMFPFEIFHLARVHSGIHFWIPFKFLQFLIGFRCISMNEISGDQKHKSPRLVMMMMTETVLHVMASHQRPELLIEFPPRISIFHFRGCQTLSWTLGLFSVPVPLVITVPSLSTTGADGDQSQWEQNRRRKKMTRIPSTGVLFLKTNS